MQLGETAVAVASGVVSAASVAPLLYAADRAVTEAAAAGAARGARAAPAAAQLAGAFASALRGLVKAPLSPALMMVVGVYSATYVTANVADCWRSSVTTKFAAVTAVNMSASVLKDAAYARMFGGMAASGPVPLASYALFALRDCLTVGAGFILPGAAAEAARSAGAGDGKAAKRGAQLAGPSAMQVVCTPVHLLALSFASAPLANTRSRFAAVAAVFPPAFLARSLRMLPAYGIGGVLNASLLAAGNARLASLRGADAEGVAKARKVTAPNDGFFSHHVSMLALDARAEWEALLDFSRTGARHGVEPTTLELEAFVQDGPHHHRAGTSSRDDYLTSADIEARMRLAHHLRRLPTRAAEDAMSDDVECDYAAVAARLLAEADEHGDGKVSAKDLSKYLAHGQSDSGRRV